MRGGGGIVPDLVIRPDTLSGGEREFAKALGSHLPEYRDVLTSFALEAKTSGTVQTESFTVTPEMRQQVYQRLRAKGIEMTPQVYEGASGLITEQLGYEIARYVFGRPAEFRRRARDDQQMQTAMELLRKAQTAQSVFDNKFLLPFAPDSPEFFLIPSDNQVTVVWRPSVSEVNGDPFFTIASNPLTPEGAPSLLFDPNYRQLDVEGYRVYRGRVDSPNQLSLVAQFDYVGTTIKDFPGQINPVPGCAPELAITTECPVTFDVPTPGVAPTVSVDVPLVGPGGEAGRPATQRQGPSGPKSKFHTGCLLLAALVTQPLPAEKWQYKQGPQGPLPGPIVQRITRCVSLV